MPDPNLAPRQRPLWPLFVAPALVAIAAIAWSGFWFYAAAKVDVVADAWRAREAKSGRVFDCAHRSVAGFPFRLEIRCDDVSVSLVSQMADQPPQAPVTARLGEVLTVAQVYDPKLVIAEFKAPARVFEQGAREPSFVVNWSKARSSMVGLPATPQRASIVFDDAAIDRLENAMAVPLASARHAELHGRIAEGSPADHPGIESVVRITEGTIHGLHPLLAQPFDADVRVMVSGLKDFAPKPWPARFREIQAAGGHIEIIQSRVRQGDVVAVATGTLGLSADGRLDGELKMTVAGVEKVIPALGIDKMLEQGVPQATLDRVAPGVKTQDINNLFGALDRALPGLGKVVKQNANVGVAAGINALGTEAVLEGRKARTFPLRFADGAVFLGPVKVADVPPLF